MQRHLRERVALVDGALRIVAVADTHSEPHAALDSRLASLAPGLIVHAGDIGDLAVVRALERHAPVIAVRGNIDGRVPGVPDVATVDVCDGDRVVLRMVLMHIAVYGPSLRADAKRIAKSEEASLIVCGHSHVPFARRDGSITVFNPGSVGPRRGQLPILFGVIEVSRESVVLRHVDCETGLDWKPSAPRG
jgi:putative phosphoesterase